ncbi:hypothetical protein [Bizionia paragorgiae]|uniref:hypothetical protein n=1 Tax=Bizionia paragorgiae TaxID=283786 RepID=UPI003A93851E
MSNSVGRPKGSKNKATAEIRERFKELVDNNLSKMQSDLDRLEPYERLTTLMQMAKFVLPTLKTVDIEHTLGGDKDQPQINIIYNHKPLNLKTDETVVQGDLQNKKVPDLKYEAFRKERINWRQ